MRQNMQLGVKHGESENDSYETDKLSEYNNDHQYNRDYGDNLAAVNPMVVTVQHKTAQ